MREKDKEREREREREKGERRERRSVYDMICFQHLGVRYGEVIQVTITEVMNYGFRVQLTSGAIKILFVSQISRDFVSLIGYYV